MPGVWRIIIVIPVAFLAACFAAALVMVVAAGAEPYAGESSGEFIGKLIVVSVIASMFVGAVAGLPVLIMIILAEAFGWRSVILHLIVGAGIGLIAFGLGIGGATESDLDIGGAAGAAAGFIYWLIAGRHAGGARSRRESARSDNTQEEAADS